MPAELKHKSEDYDGWLSKSWIQEEYIHLDVLPTHLELSRRYSFRYIEITVIDTSPKWQAVFSNPQVQSETSASTKDLSIPAINDHELDNIYQVGLKTLQDCMQDVLRMVLSVIAAYGLGIFGYKHWQTMQRSKILD